MANNVHHRLPRSRGGKSNKYNCANVNKTRHYWWHCMFSNMTGEQIMQDINTNWLDPRFKIVKR
jgi:hypothetical protein